MSIISRDYENLIGFALNNSKHSISSLAEILSIPKASLIGEKPLSVEEQSSLDKLRGALDK